MRRIKETTILICLFLTGLLGLWGCSSPSSDSIESSENMQIEELLEYESSEKLKYAEQFTIDYYEEGYALITTIFDGAKFLIVPEGKEAPEYLTEEIVVLKQPLDNVYLVATAVMDMFCELDALDTIRFSSQKEENWCMEEAREQMQNGKIVYAGKYSAPDYELIVSEGCSLAIENNMISHSPEVIEKLESFGIPVFIDYSSYESHPLGRVEWVKVYGLLSGKESEAEKAFEEQCEIMDRVVSGEASDKTVAFFYIATNGMVNVRSSYDYVPKMIELAGGEYIFAQLGDEESNRSTVTMQMEEFYAAAKNADCLVYNSTIDGEIETIEELLEKESLLRDFKAVQEGNVWCTTKDLYQESMSIGGMIEDFHNMLSGNESLQENMSYMYRLK
ncbi:MAG: ABC transporter substrate-binding protein [Ruminococcus sp.]|nr:ABC transporter substrate-binding protein [Ruminococcus sp.]